MKTPTLTRDEITDEMIADVRRCFNSNDQITEDLLGILSSSALYHEIKNLTWNDNPVDVDAQVTLNLQHFMLVKGLNKRYRALNNAIKSGLIQNWYSHIRIGHRDSYENRIISPARIVLMYDLEGYGKLIDQRKLSNLWGQIEAVNGHFVAYIDELRYECGQRIMQFDTDKKVKDYIMSNKEMVVWILGLR